MIKKYTITIINYFIVIISSMIIVSCGISGSQVPSDHYYRLPAPQVAEKFNTNISQILIRPVKVEGLYHERSILYVEQDTPLEVKRYHYHYWVEPPAKLVQKHLQNYLQQSTLAKVVTTIPGHEPASIEIIPTVVGFERLVQKGKIQNLVAIHFHISFSGDDSQPWSKDYQVITDSESASMHDSAKGIGQALDQIMARLVSDLVTK